MVLVDSHQHFWDPGILDMPSAPPEAAVLNRPYLPKDLLPELRNAGVFCTVLVQGFPQALSTNNWYFQLADENDFIAGVVAWIDLTQPDSLSDTLDHLQQESKFVGIRHILDLESDPNWILQNEVIQSLRELARRNVPFDLCVNPDHLGNVLALFELIPDLRVVIDHIAKPAIAQNRLAEWKPTMQKISQNPNAYCKLSGMVTEADWKQWKPKDLAPYVDTVLQAFGDRRLLFGSDWPVCLLAASYGELWQALNSVLNGLATKQKHRIFGETAIEFYGLRIPATSYTDS